MLVQYVRAVNRVKISENRVWIVATFLSASITIKRTIRSSCKNVKYSGKTCPVLLIYQQKVFIFDQRWVEIGEHVPLLQVILSSAPLKRVHLDHMLYQALHTFVWYAFYCSSGIIFALTIAQQLWKIKYRVTFKKNLCNYTAVGLFKSLVMPMGSVWPLKLESFKRYPNENMSIAGVRSPLGMFLSFDA